MKEVCEDSFKSKIPTQRFKKYVMYTELQLRIFLVEYIQNTNFF